MYRIYNKSLDETLSVYKVSDLSQISEDDLFNKVCENFRVSPVTIIDPKTMKVTGRSKFKTIDKIIDNLSASLYMGREYWDTKHHEIAKDRELDRDLAKATTGEETVKLFQNLKWGVWKLKPGEDIELDLSTQFVNYIRGQSVAILLQIEEITNTSSMPVNEQVTRSEGSIPSIEGAKDIYSYLDLQEIKDMVKLRNKKLPKEERTTVMNKERDELIDFLKRTAK